MEAIDDRLKQEIMAFARRYIASGIAGIVGCFAQVAKLVKEKYGKEGDNLLKKACREAGSKVGQIWKDKLTIVEGSMKDLDQVLTSMATEIGMEYRLIELSDKRILYRITFCPYTKGWKILEAPEDICDLWASWISGVCEAINPKVVYKYTKSIHKGDPYCEMVYELKK